MNELLRFLLPATGMDWFFALLLMSWAGFALYAAARAKKSIDIRINSSHFKNIKASAHDLSIASRHPVWDHIVDNAPGFALVLGLLGTFLGIGLAIQGAGIILADLNTNASDATDIRQTIGNLSPMLAEIGLKFKSSAWGIITHIFLRIAIPAYGIEEKRLYEIFKELESDYNEEEQQKEERWGIVEQVEDILNQTLFAKNAQEGSIAKLLMEQNEYLSTIATVQKDFGKNVQSLGSSVNDFEKTVNEFRENVKKSLSDMQSTTQKTSKGLQDAVNAMKEEVRTTFGEFRENVATTLNKVGDDIASSSEAIKSSVDVLSETMSKELQTVTRVTGDLTTHSREMTVAIQNQMQVLTEMGDRVERISSQGAKYAFALEDVTANVAQLAGSDGVMVKRLDRLVTETVETKDASKNSDSKLEQLIKETVDVKAATKGVAVQLERIITESQKLTNLTEKAMKK